MELLEKVKQGARLIDEKFDKKADIETVIRITLCQFMDNELTLEETHSILLTFVVLGLYHENIK